MKYEYLNNLLFLLGPDGKYHFHKVHLLFLFIAVFLVVGIGVFIYVIYHRKKSRRRAKKLYHARLRYTEKLTIYLFSDAGDERIAELFPASELDKPWNRMALQEVAFLYHRDFEGQAREKLRHLYKKLELDRFTSEKLDSKEKWHHQAQAIREIAELDLRSFEPRLRDKLNSDIPEIRAEARTALFKLHGFKDISFITKTQRHISDWEQIRILNLLSNSQMNLSDVPSFKEGLYSRNETVVIFCVRLINYFMQYESINELIRLLDHHNPKVRREVILALVHLEATKAVPELTKRLEGANRDGMVLLIYALGELGNEDVLPAIEKYLTEEDQEMNLLILDAMRKLGDQGRQRVIQLSSPKDSLYHPLLKQLKREHHI